MQGWCPLFRQHVDRFLYAKDSVKCWHSDSSEQVDVSVLMGDLSVGRQMLNKALTSSVNNGVRVLWANYHGILI